MSLLSRGGDGSNGNSTNLADDRPVAQSRRAGKILTQIDPDPTRPGKHTKSY